MARAGSKLAQRLADRVRRTPPPAAIATDPQGEPLPLAALLNAFSEPLLLLRDTLVEHANAAARALLGAHAEGEDVRMVIRHPEGAALLADYRAGGASLGGLGDSERLWYMAVSILDPRHRLIRLEDRSGQLAAERMRTDFVANASHELRTPLAAISGFIETLEEANGPDEAPIRSRFLGIMGTEARRMQRLIDDLMSLSRVEADRFVRPSRPLDLAAAVRTACAEIEAGGKADGRIVFAIEGQPIVPADPSQISQLVHNIVGNALKYSADGGSVEVRLRRGGDNAVLTVADHGEGIAEEHLPRLTERFYRVDPGRSRQLGGTGLGLAIVKHIVERHRGRLEIASEAGVGTTVTVRLPLAGQSL
jgi:two-component system phosphate regulon sensor histidine kinase PhoR